MDIKQLKSLIDDNEQISLHLFAAKLSNANEQFPEDYTIGAMANITAKMQGSKFFITRAEIKNLYKKLYSRNTKFSALFSEELGEIEKVAAPKIYDRSDEYDYPPIHNDVDQTLLNAFNIAFDNKAKTYSDKHSKAAKELVGKTYASKDVEVVNGTDKFIICRASYETPKGKTDIFVPVEIVENKCSYPDVFIGNAGVEDLSNIKNYILSNAGKKLNIPEQFVFSTLNTNSNNISNVDLALIKLNFEKNKEPDEKYEFEDPKNNVKDLETKKYNDPEIESFAKTFDTVIGTAVYHFGKVVINSSRKVIENKLNSFGMKNYQMSLINSNDNGVSYAISLEGNKVAFKVPVKIENDKVFDPEIIVANGNVYKFEKSSINNILSKNAVDYKTAAIASPLYDLKPSDLVDIVKSAMEENNYSKAEDAMNVLLETGDQKAYQSAYNIFLNALNNIEQKTNSCSLVVKNKYSSHNLCGHTGLPLHKVYQDNNGDCHPLYRREMEISNIARK
jgi:hypothetical protein